MATTDDFSIDYTGATDVTVALRDAVNATVAGNTFTFHTDGLFQINPDSTHTNSWIPSGITIDGQGASLFRTVRRSGYTTANRYNMVTILGSDVTLRNLNLYGYREDVYTGDKLTTVAGSPTVVSTTVELDALDEEVRLPQVGLDYFRSIPNGDLTPQFHAWETPFYSRSVDGLNRFKATLSDTNGVTDDCVFAIIDDSDDSVLASATYTLTGTPTEHELTFDPGTDYLGTRLRVTVRKATATANTITVAQIVAFNEAGYRRKNQTGYTGGDEFAHGIYIGSGTGSNTVTVEDCHVEGVDGDYINATPDTQNVIVTRLTGRGCGRQGFVIEKADHVTVSDIVFREVGRAGVDYEPNSSTWTTSDTTFTNCTFLNCRNFTFAMNKFAQIFDVTLTDITSTNAGMGPIFGGAMGMTVTNFTHTNTYRSDADRILNSPTPNAALGQPPPWDPDVIAASDAVVFGQNMVFDQFHTDIGFYLPYQGRGLKVGTVTTIYYPDDITVYVEGVDNPDTDPPWVIDPGVTNSVVWMPILIEPTAYTVTPSLPQATIEQIVITAETITVTPSQPAAEIINAQNVDTVAYTITPTLPAAQLELTSVAIPAAVSVTPRRHDPRMKRIVRSSL